MDWTAFASPVSRTRAVFGSVRLGGLLSSHPKLGRKLVDVIHLLDIGTFCLVPTPLLVYGKMCSRPISLVKYVIYLTMI